MTTKTPDTPTTAATSLDPTTRANFKASDGLGGGTGTGHGTTTIGDGDGGKTRHATASPIDVSARGGVTASNPTI